MKIRFIINPVSGASRTDLAAWQTLLRAVYPAADIQLTTGPGHATLLAREASAAGYDRVIAVGGDGTINETARGLVGTQTALGVIPHGSGNGLARELGMPLKLEEAIKCLPHATLRRVDVGRANGELFLNVAGVGLEAEIAWQFMQHGKTGKRGKWPYFKLGTKTIFTYRPPEFTLNVDGKEEKTSPLTLVFANGRQYGSNVKIAPNAQFDDGQLDMVSVANAPKWKLAWAAPSFVCKMRRPEGIVTTTRVKNVTVTSSGNFPYHIDGEPRQATGKLEIATEPKALFMLFVKK